MRVFILVAGAFLGGSAAAEAPKPVTPPPATETQLTIYNQDFAAVKERRVLDLVKGENEVRVTGMTSQLEPDSVVLRDLKSPGALRILEQNYDSNPLSSQYMLRAAEGQVIEFELPMTSTGEQRIVKGKVIRAGSQPDYYQRVAASEGEPIVEIDGKVHFGLPGKPIFSALDGGAFLKPTLRWQLASDAGGRHDVEISYLTGGFHWDATYNLVATKGDAFDLVGWVTLENRSGKDFDQTAVKLIAGDVNRVTPDRQRHVSYDAAYAMSAKMASGGVTERSFEEYHLYTLPRPTALHDRETKQVEFLRAAQVPAKRSYVYDGARLDRNETYQSWSQSAGTQSNQTVATMLEVVNSEKSGLGVPLPRGTAKLYRKDLDGRSEFVGEDQIRHTPRNETLRLSLGNAFDITGERKQTNYEQGKTGGSGAPRRDTVDESFEIKVRNHKAEAVEVRVVEHLWRGHEWSIVDKSQDFTKTDATTIEFRVPVASEGEGTVRYTVHYVR